MPDEKNQIDQAAEMVKSIPEFMEAVSGVLQTPYGWFVLTALLIWFLINRDLSHLLGLFERGEKTRIEKLESYLERESSADEGSLRVIKDLRDAHYFKIATGIYAEKWRRESLIKLHDNVSHTINWVQIKRALPFIKITSDKSVSIRGLTFLEKVGHYYNIAVGFLFSFFAIAAILVFIVSDQKSILSIIIGLGGAIGSAFFAMFVFSQNWPYNSAEKIKEELSRISSLGEPLSENDQV